MATRDACSEQVIPLIRLACEVRELNNSQLQADSMSFRGSGEIDRLLLRLNNLEVPQELKSKGRNALGTGIERIHQRVDQALQDINTRGLPFDQRREAQQDMARALSNLQFEISDQLIDLALESAGDCYREER